MTDYLRARYGGETIMASMGSLGHYMQELSGAGLQVRDFLHEGNGDLWLRALNRRAAIVGWILIDEQGEGGDMRARIARENPKILDGFTRVADAAGIALYERQNRTFERRQIAKPPRAIFEATVRTRAGRDRGRRLIPDFPTEIELAQRKPDASQYQGPDVRAAASETDRWKMERVGVDELACFGVPPRKDADASADVRLHERLAPERQEPERQADWNNPQVSCC
jgi:hypothetical protein